MTTLSAHPADVACIHCGLPVPPGLVEPAASEQFCCHGCRAVYETIRGCGLEQFYRLRETGGAKHPQSQAVVGRGYEQFDDPAFHELYVREVGEGLRHVELYLEGVHCGACVWLVERLPHVLAGVGEVRLDIRRSVASVVWDPRRVRLSRIAGRLESLGYPPHPNRGRSLREARRAEDRRQLIRIGVAAALAGNVMVISFALYGGMFHGMETMHRTLFQGTAMVLTVLALLWPGRTFLRGAWGALRAGTVHMDIPIAVGLLAGTAWSLVNTLRGAGEVYFDSVTLLIFLLLLGRWIQLRQQRSSADAVELLYSLTPGTARRVEGESVTQVPLEALRPGDLIEVCGGASVPADGVIEAGSSELDLALMTGESRPVGVGPGQRVHAGTVNLSERLLVRVDVAGEGTRLGRLMQLVERAARTRAPIVQLADRVAGVFVVVVLVLAAATAALWLVVDPAHALGNALALLIVTCPCALGLATPLAMMAGIGRAARRGILVKGGESLECLSRPGILVLDKTGTLTRGKLSVVRWHGREDLQPLAAAVERHCAHPSARAFVRAFGDRGNALEVCDVRTSSAGIEAEAAGRGVCIGSPGFVTSRGAVLPAWCSTIEADLVGECLSPVFVAVDGRVEAIAGLGDPLADDARESIEILQREGWDVRILSGDHASIVAAVGREVGLDAAACHGGVSPEDKLSQVQSWQRDRPVVMVGDGVNDAAALAAASVGVAVKGGAEASLAAADVYISRAGLSPVVELCAGAERVMGVIRTNLGVSLGYNVIGVTLAAAGLINPLVAAILMPLSSLTVISLSCRRRTFGEKPCR